MNSHNDPAPSDELVFKPVPTQEDMIALSGEVSRARAGRSRLFITVVFLAGVVAAGGIGMSMVKRNAASVAQKADAQIAALNKQILDKDAQLAAQAGIIEKQKVEIGTYTSFQSIAALQSQSDQLELEIAQLLAEPNRAGAPKRLSELPPEVEWMDSTVTALTARRDKLQKLKAEVQAWPPAPISPRPD